MQYMGGKTRIAKEVSSIINENLKPGDTFVSPFCGSCSIETLIESDKKILNDKNKYLIAMWQAYQEGWRPRSR